MADGTTARRPRYSAALARSILFVRRQLSWRPPTRVLDMTLTSASRPGLAVPALQRRRSLAAGERYQLTVDLGDWSPSGLVTGVRRSGLLRRLTAVERLTAGAVLEGRSEILDDVTADLDVVLLGPSVQTPENTPGRWLSSGVPTGPVTFDVTVPEPGEHGARLSVLRRGAIVQSYRLSLRVEDRERWHIRPVVEARLQHSATREWSNMEDLGPRDLALVLNAAPDGHRLYLYGDGAAAVVPVQATKDDEAAKGLRNLLTSAARGDREVQAIVWELAEKGHELFQSIYLRLQPGAADQEVLRELLTDDGARRIQVLRADPDQALPWPLLYDWPLPEHLVGTPLPPVCFGSVAGGSPCAHSSGDAAVCVRGFWGIRHEVDELLVEPRLLDVVPDVPPTVPKSVLAFGVGGDIADAFERDLEKLFGADGTRKLTPQDTFLETLADGRRPGVVVVLGHHETEDKKFEPKGSRILLATADRWFRPVNLTDSELAAGPWGEPHSLVLLLSCDSAAPKPTELTSFLTALRSLRAGAVVGTECTLYPAQAARFTVELLSAMTAQAGGPPPKRLGEAVREARTRIVVEGRDPVGLAFAVFGPAELRLHW